MRPLNYAILKYYTGVEKASVNEILEDLKHDYKGHRAFKRKSIIEALMTAESNGLIEEAGADFVNDELTIYYRANQEQKETINNYIK